MKVHEQHKKKGPEVVNIALVVVSTSRFEEQEKGAPSSDKTIPLVKKLLDGDSSPILYKSLIVSDSPEQIKSALNKLINDIDLHAIIFSGGTGLTPKDITYETIQPLLEKELDGFGEIFRSLSFQEIGPAAMLSRATAGKIKDKAVFLLPGSPNAVILALEKLILPELRHIVYIINKKE